MEVIVYTHTHVHIRFHLYYLWLLTKYLSTYFQKGGQTASNSQAQVDERAKGKREREKARHAAMTQEDRDERNKKTERKVSSEKGRNYSCWVERSSPSQTFFNNPT